MVRLKLFQTTYLLKSVTNEKIFSFVILLVGVIFSKKNVLSGVIGVTWLFFLGLVIEIWQP